VHGTELSLTRDTYATDQGIVSVIMETKHSTPSKEHGIGIRNYPDPVQLICNIYFNIIKISVSRVMFYQEFLKYNLQCLFYFTNAWSKYCTLRTLQFNGLSIVPMTVNYDVPFLPVVAACCSNLCTS